MIIFGHRASRITSGRLSNVTCPDCNSQTTYSYSIFGRYVHIYWIPLFPFAKTSVLECDNCKKTYTPKEVSERIKHKYDVEKKRTGVPVWHFSGLFIIAAFLCYLYVIFEKQHQKELLYAKTPIIGDIYTVEGDSSGYYTTLKVIGITKDSIFVAYNKFMVNSVSGYKRIDFSENYDEINIDGFSKKDIPELYNSKKIREINRE